MGKRRKQKKVRPDSGAGETSGIVEVAATDPGELRFLGGATLIALFFLYGAVSREISRDPRIGPSLLLVGAPVFAVFFLLLEGPAFLLLFLGQRLQLLADREGITGRGLAWYGVCSFPRSFELPWDQIDAVNYIEKRSRRGTRSGTLEIRLVSGRSLSFPDSTVGGTALSAAEQLIQAARRFGRPFQAQAWSGKLHRDLAEYRRSALPKSRSGGKRRRPRLRRKR